MDSYSTQDITSSHGVPLEITKPYITVRMNLPLPTDMFCAMMATERSGEHGCVNSYSDMR